MLLFIFYKILILLQFFNVKLDFLFRIIRLIFRIFPKHQESCYQFFVGLFWRGQVFQCYNPNKKWSEKKVNKFFYILFFEYFSKKQIVYSHKIFIYNYFVIVRKWFSFYFFSFFLSYIFIIFFNFWNSCCLFCWWKLKITFIITENKKPNIRI